MTGITRVSKESVFSDLNNLTVVTATSDLYADSFGFTEKEVRTALKEYGVEDKMPGVKQWYDGFAFGHSREIYNPWSIMNYLKTGKLSAPRADRRADRVQPAGYFRKRHLELASCRRIPESQRLSDR